MLPKKVQLCKRLPSLATCWREDQTAGFRAELLSPFRSQFQRLRVPRHNWLLLPQSLWKQQGIHTPAHSGDTNPIIWIEAKQKALDTLKTAGFGSSPRTFRDILKLFYLFMKQKIKGIITQTLGPWILPVTYLSQWLYLAVTDDSSVSLMKESKQVNPLRSDTHSTP